MLASFLILSSSSSKKSKGYLHKSHSLNVNVTIVGLFSTCGWEYIRLFALFIRTSVSAFLRFRRKVGNESSEGSGVLKGTEYLN